jgi:hypothetical protein
MGKSDENNLFKIEKSKINIYLYRKTINNIQNWR